MSRGLNMSPDGRRSPNSSLLSKSIQHPWRLMVFYLIGLFIFGFPLRDFFIPTLGWSAIPFGIWFLVFTVIASSKPLLIIKKIRPLIASLFITMAMSGILGMINAPIGSVTGRSIGGEIGNIIAISPNLWDRFNVSPFDYTQAITRIAILIIISLSIIKPRLTFIFFQNVFRLTFKILKSIAKNIIFGLGTLTSTRQKISFKQTSRKQLKNYTQKPANIMVSGPEQTINSGGVREINGSHTKHQQKSSLSNFSTSATFIDKEISDVNVKEENENASITETSVETKSGNSVEILKSPDTSAFNWILPSISLLKEANAGGITPDEIAKTSQLIEDSLAQYGIDVSVDQTFAGPTVTMYGLKPGWKGGGSEPLYGKRVRVDMILSREKDIALALASPNIRFEPVIPGESVVGIEIPNKTSTPVTLRSVLSTSAWKNFIQHAQIPVPLGFGSDGDPVFADLANMPHTLIAGATGSGKSVCINALITGLLMTRTPYQIRMVMIDPKRVELTPYSGIPHLYTPVVVESEQAILVLKGLVKEMMGRFKVLEQAGVKNIVAYNQQANHIMPYIVVLVDELADLMLQAANEVERLLVRLAQLGRATGIHLVVATQRPSVDVVTGLIKANFPSRISFAVMSQIDSRTVLDSTGGEKLLGRGDMLYLPVDSSRPSRVQGALLSDSEIDSIVESWTKIKGAELPELDTSVENSLNIEYDNNTSVDSLTDKAILLARSHKTLSTSLLQRRLRVGYPRAARLMDELEEMGVVGPGELGKPRQVLPF